jgi:hypothetical protein
MVAVPHNDRIGYALVEKVIVLGSCVPKTGQFGLRAKGPRNAAPLFGIGIRTCCSSEVMTLGKKSSGLAGIETVRLLTMTVWR